MAVLRVNFIIELLLSTDRWQYIPTGNQSGLEPDLHCRADAGDVGVDAGKVLEVSW
jgi:hypothetical protein